jgi:hypothetical protein
MITIEKKIYLRNENHSEYSMADLHGKAVIIQERKPQGNYQTTPQRLLNLLLDYWKKI